MEFRDRLIATLQAVEPVLEEPGVLVIGSEVPNLLEGGAASTLVVSQDVDIGVPVTSHAGVKRRLRELRGLRPSAEEPSVWVPDDPKLIEVNFVGMDPRIEGAGDTYVLADAELPHHSLAHGSHRRHARPAATSGEDRRATPAP